MTPSGDLQLSERSAYSYCQKASLIVFGGLLEALRGWNPNRVGLREPE